MSLLALLAAIGQTGPSAPPAPPPPAPPRRVAPRDYSFVCSLRGKDEISQRVSGRFYDNNGAMAWATVTGNSQIPLPPAGASTLVSDVASFHVRSKGKAVDYSWSFYLPSTTGSPSGYVTVAASSSTRPGETKMLGYVATGLCDFTTSESRMR
jgi:hypothetical protein